MSLSILGVGTALPAHAINQSKAAEVAQVLCCRTDEQAAVVPALYRQTGITTRHLIFGDDVMEDVLNGTEVTQCVFLPASPTDDHGPSTQQRMECYKRDAGPLALEAASGALKQSGLGAEAITHLITVSCTGFSAPGVDTELIKSLGLSNEVERTHIGFMGCHGALNGLRVARAFADADQDARILLAAVELCSLHYHYGWDPKRVVANALFADGAAAVVGVQTKHDALTVGPKQEFGTDGQTQNWQVAATGARLFADSEYAMTWDIGDHGFEMTLSTRVPGLIADNVRPWLAQWLSGHGLEIATIGSWAVHPGGPRILSAVEEGLCLRRDALETSREVLTECGNMSSPTVLFIVDLLRKRRAPLPCVALAFGPGLAAEAVLFH